MPTEFDSNKKLPVPNVIPDGIDVSHDIQPEIDLTSPKPDEKKKSAPKQSRVGSKNIPDKTGGPPFKTHKPCKEPIDPESLLDEISATIRQFVILDQNQADAAALWVAHTYFVPLFSNSPIAIINAPERACAKTLFQNVLAKLCCRSLSASNITPSAVFRAIDLWMPTLFIDEADTFFKDNPDLQGMVNAGYSREGVVIRSEVDGDSFRPTVFPVYCAKSIAGIALERHLPDATMSRGIVFHMRRKLPHEKVTRLRYAEPGLFDGLATKLERFALDYEDKIEATRPTLPDELSDRAQDNWEPLLAIASCVGNAWFERATRIALELSKPSNEMVSTGNELLSDIRSIFDNQVGVDQYSHKISSEDLLRQLTAIEDGPWATYNNGRPISARQLAKQLSAYGIGPKTVRLKFNTPKGYDRAQFDDVFARYLYINQSKDEPDQENPEDAPDHPEPSPLPPDLKDLY